MNSLALAKSSPWIVSSSLALGFASPSLAATIVNGGFESPTVGAGGYLQLSGGQNLGGWTVLGSNAGIHQTLLSSGGIVFTAQEGLNSLDLTGNDSGGKSNGVGQQIVTNAGETYRLSFFVGVASNGRNFSLPSTVDLSINNQAKTSFTNSNLVFGTATWQPFFQDFTAASSSTTISFFSGTDSSPLNNFIGLDNVQIASLGQSTSVPEPFTVIGTLLGGTAAVRMRKKLKASSNHQN